MSRFRIRPLLLHKGQAELQGNSFPRDARTYHAVRPCKSSECYTFKPYQEGPKVVFSCVSNVQARCTQASGSPPSYRSQVQERTGRRRAGEEERQKTSPVAFAAARGLRSRIRPVSAKNNHENSVGRAPSRGLAPLHGPNPAFVEATRRAGFALPDPTAALRDRRKRSTEHERERERKRQESEGRNSERISA